MVRYRGKDGVELSETEEKRKGFTNGFNGNPWDLEKIPPNGFTNGLPSGSKSGTGKSKALRELPRSALSRRYRIYIMSILTAVSILLPVLFAVYFSSISPSRPPGILIDGEFDDWKGIHAYADSANDQENQNTNLLFLKVDSREMNDQQLLSIYLEVKGNILENPPLSSDILNHMSTVHVFIDSDSNEHTGYSIRGMGADYLLEIKGIKGIVKTRYLKSFDNEKGNDDWNGWTRGKKAPSVALGHTLEAQAAVSNLYQDVQLLCHLTDPLGNEDYSPIFSIENRAVLNVNQKSIAPSIIPLGQEARFLKIDLNAKNKDVTLLSLSVRKRGTVPSDGIKGVFLYMDQGDGVFGAAGDELLSTGTLSEERVFFELDEPLRVSEGKPERLFLTVSLKQNAVPSSTLGFGIESRMDVYTSSGLVLLNIENELRYVGSPPENVLIDGAFGDWIGISGQDDAERETDSPLKTYSENRDLTNCKILKSDEDISFCLKVDGFMMGGSEIPLVYEAFNEIAVPVSRNTSSNESEENTLFEKVLPERLGEDTAWIFLYTDSRPDTGYAAGGLPVGADYLLEVRGKNGRVLDRTIYRYEDYEDGTGSDMWRWTALGEINAAVGGSEMEVQIPLSSIFSDDTADSIGVYFVISDWKKEIGDSSNLFTYDFVSDEMEDIAPKSSTGSSSLEKYPNGAIAANSRHPIYLPGENAEILITVLDRDGVLVLEADIEVEVISPGGSRLFLTSSDGQVIRESHGVFKAGFQTNEVGIYNFTVSAKGDKVDASQSSCFEVRDKLDFDIIRHAPMFVDPRFGPFKFSIEIIPYVEVSKLTLRESLPDDIMVAAAGHGDLSIQNGTQVLTWRNLSGNIEVSYEIDFPEVWPEIYEFGPCEIGWDGESFLESRPWMVASDPAVTDQTHYAVFNETGAKLGSDDTLQYVKPSERIYLVVQIDNTLFGGVDEIDYQWYLQWRLKGDVAWSEMGEIGGIETWNYWDGIGSNGTTYTEYFTDTTTGKARREESSISASVESILFGEIWEFNYSIEAPSTIGTAYEFRVVKSGSALATYSVYPELTVRYEYSLTESNITLNGTEVNSEFGHSVSKAGDVNGDGFCDVIIGADKALNLEGTLNTGAAYIFFGASSPQAYLDVSDADVTIGGKNESDDFGYSVSFAGDVNNDGYADVIIGAPYADPSGVTSCGESYIIFGSPSMPPEINATDADVVLVGKSSEDYSGFSVSNAGDVNFDGFDDVLIGAPGANSWGGGAYIVYGTSDLPSVLSLNDANVTLEGTQSGNALTGGQAGLSVSWAGDINNDFYDDVIVGAPYEDIVPATECGRSYIIYGSSTLSGALLLSDADVVLNGFVSGDYSGISVSTAGDMNGDGYDDVLVGADWADGGGINSGRTFIVYGNAALPASITLSDSDIIIDGMNDYDYSGFAVSCAGDVNSDGYDDIIIGAYGVSGDTGTAYVIYGGENLPSSMSVDSAALKLNGIASGDKAGYSVSCIADFNGDGGSDVIIGAYSAKPDTVNSNGQVYIIYGDPDELPQVIINEVFSYGDYTTEWVEIYVADTDSVDMTGWVLTDQDGNEFYFPSVVMAPGDYAVIHSGSGTNETSKIGDYWDWYIGASLGILNDDGDELLLIKKDSDKVDFMIYNRSSGSDREMDYYAEGMRWVRDGTGSGGHAPAPLSSQSVGRNGFTDTDKASDWYIFSDTDVSMGAQNPVLFEFHEILFPIAFLLTAYFVARLKRRENRREREVRREDDVGSEGEAGREGKAGKNGEAGKENEAGRDGEAGKSLKRMSFSFLIITPRRLKSAGDDRSDTRGSSTYDSTNVNVNKKPTNRKPTKPLERSGNLERSEAAEDGA